MTAFEWAMTALLIIHAIGHGGLALCLYRTDLFSNMPIRKLALTGALLLLAVSAVGGLDATMNSGRPNFGPLILGRMGGVIFVWSYILLRWNYIWPALKGQPRNKDD